MPISIQYLRERTRQAAGVGQAGYSTDAEFNNSLKQAQDTLFSYYKKIYHQTGEIHDALAVFVTEVTLPLTQGLIAATTTRPPNYAHELQIFFRKVTNADCNPPEIKLVPVHPMHDHQEAEVLSDPILKPSIQKNQLWKVYKNGLLHIYPNTVTDIYYKYLRKPQEPLVNGLPTWYVSTIITNTNGDFQNFDPVNSTDLEWEQEQADDFVALMLYYTGAMIKDNPIVNYAIQQQQEGVIK